MIDTAIIPAAGLGTRLDPITSAIPKELVPTYNNVALFRVGEEALRAGIRRIIIVNSHSKAPLANPLEEYFRVHSSSLTFDSPPVVFEVFQESPLGLGHAISMARDKIDNFPVAVMLPDVLLPEDDDSLSRMIETSSGRYNVICVRKAVQPQLMRSGVIEFEGEFHDKTEVVNLIEKPEKGLEPSDWMVVGRYILTSEVFDSLDDSPAGLTGEIELTDSIASVARNERGRVLACQLFGSYQDTGTHDGLFHATLAQFVSRHPDSVYTETATKLLGLLEADLGVGSG